MARCNGKTLNGKRCQRNALSGLKRCSLHTTSSKKKISSSKSKSKSRKSVSKSRKPASKSRKSVSKKPTSRSMSGEKLSGGKYYQYIGATRKCNPSAKYWGVKVEGTSLLTHYGKFGSKGRITKKKFSSSALAKDAMAKKIREKLNKGYSKLNRMMIFRRRRRNPG